MFRLRILSGLIAIVTFTGCMNDDKSHSTKVAPPTVAKPNVILIVIDTARADHFSAYGYDHPTTPNIDALARDSVRFVNAHSVAPWTLPAHMSMFTGLLPGQHGATWDAFSGPPEMSVREMVSRRFQLSQPERMLTSRLKTAGYRTWGISTNPWVSFRTGFGAGFDSFIEVWRRSSNFEQFYAKLPSGLKNDPVLDQTATGQSIVFFKHKFVTNFTEEPFFVFFNFTDTHFPYVPPDNFIYKFNGNPDVFARISRQPEEFTELALLGGYKPFDLKEMIPFYDAELNYVDFMIGNLIDWLRSRNLYDETLIIITSDHGEHLGEDGRFSHQLSIEQELLSVPLIIKYPNSAYAGNVIDNPLVSNIDIYETIIGATGSDLELTQYDSFSEDLTLMITRGTIERRQLFSELYFSEAYLRQIKRQYAPFDESIHKVVRRAMYVDGYKIKFNNFEQTSIEPFGKQLNLASVPPDPATIRKSILDYVKSIDGLDLQNLEPAPQDQELIDRLQSLGYLDSTSTPAN